MNNSNNWLVYSLVTCLSTLELQFFQLNHKFQAEIQEKLVTAEQKREIAEKEKSAYRLAVKDLGEHLSCPKTK